ncbi:hypothetical protein HOY34_11175 [Xinfangfangia sp. D13-10-4-6]|uniref:hypothetical protein n=1 Tax=Pseudogemmobacter hezensis TaxID=2737662 RepID=UPI001555724C|nr:hypothetical protein [Pseudogemmobacter hezensis]NPD15764.1 hypothetical protein [Pseudogemmobacter hezensis]
MKAQFGKPLVNLETGDLTHTVEVFAQGGWHYLAVKSADSGKAEIWHGSADEAEAKIADLKARAA